MTDACVPSPAADAGPIRRIGLFGGSFDPVHVAHVALARTALEHLALDELRWVPVGMPWQKHRRLASGADREAMVALAIDGEPRFVLDRCELERGGPSYTIDTVRAARAGDPGAQWWLVIGQDQYAHFHTWHGWQELLGLVTLAVAGRAGEPPQPPAALAGVPHRAVGLPLPAMAVSSTALREALQAGQGIDGMVPPAVARYIARHHPYPRTP